MKGEKKSLHQKLTEEFIWLDSKYGHPPYHSRLIKEIFSSALDKKDKIIEIGCGAGGLSRRLAQIVTEGEVVGIDISEGHIKKLKQSDVSASSNLVFRLGSAENIPYPDDYFDHAICSVSFSFWSEPERGLAEVKRVLKSGGKLCIADGYEEGPIWATGGARVFDLWSPYKMNIYSSEEFREFLQRAGFTVVYQKEVMGTLVTMGTKKPGDESPS
jgi:SAM-dependent methyltransferase